MILVIIATGRMAAKATLGRSDLVWLVARAAG